MDHSRKSSPDYYCPVNSLQFVSMFFSTLFKNYKFKLGTCRPSLWINCITAVAVLKMTSLSQVQTWIQNSIHFAKKDPHFPSPCVCLLSREAQT